MSDPADALPAAFRQSADILQDVRRAEALLRATFDAACLDRQGLLAQPDRCSDALTAAIRALLDAQKRLADTQWPQPDYQAVHMAEDAAA
ncbi:hypothetical protein FNB15_01930 [Ferrovibrio terrae]|uniref:Uncharacterized protein n=1 Tax=Ferrovibrio terrae TaxID=2594003 RepID=A0A516GX43_9PROT|nr:hypothetical protein [Ferrovibrio terrae]QDO96113.1 hypothetical protein FNB15_01930 [Ferrovibrio terrae]